MNKRGGSCSTEIDNIPFVQTYIIEFSLSHLLLVVLSTGVITSVSTTFILEENSFSTIILLLFCLQGKLYNSKFLL
jgi:hypothetical protein